MNRDIARLLLFSDLGEDAILTELADAITLWNNTPVRDLPAIRAKLARRIHIQVNRLLDLAAQYGFDRDLWQNYLTFLLITNENSFTLMAERAIRMPDDASLCHLAKADLAVFKRLFDYDFEALEIDLDISCFTELTHFTALPQRPLRCDPVISEKIRALSQAIRRAATIDEVFALVTTYCRTNGVGLFGLNRAFRLDDSGALTPIRRTDPVLLSDLIGYEEQKRALRENTEAFVHSRSCNNMLLYGDAGTGKSTAVKALLNEYGAQGLRMIELHKHQLGHLSEVIARVRDRRYRFMIFIDDLSFEEHEVEYKFLKAVIEGGLETCPDNVLIVATSNRRHLVRETWRDRSDMEYENDLHRSDTMEEKLSLAARFGCLVCFSSPTRQQFHAIVKGIAARHPDLALTEEQLLAEANRWELRHGGISGRTAQQFINYIAGFKEASPHGHA